MPKTLNDFVGNLSVKNELIIELEACRLRKVVPDHILLTGPSGSGKTSIAEIIANETGMEFHNHNSSLINDLFEDVIMPIGASQSTSGCIIFDPAVVLLDECHVLDKKIQNTLLKIMLEKKAYYQGLHFDFCNITFIFATTDADRLIQPLKMRCPLRFNLNRYSIEELTEIMTVLEVEDNGGQWLIPIPHNTAYYVATRSRMIPRVGKDYMKRVYQHARRMAGEGDPETIIPKISQLMTPGMAEAFFNMRGIKDNGMTAMDVQYLQTLKASSKALGVATIASQMEINEDLCRHEIEPFLKHLGLISFSRSGREITKLGMEVLV